MVSIIIVYYNTPGEIIDLVKSIKNAINKYLYEIIVIDNNSSTKLPNKIYNFQITKINNNQNIGYGRALNQGAKIAKGKYLLFCNSDLVFEKESIKLIIERMESDLSIGIIGPQLLDPNKNTLKVGSDFPFFLESIFSFSILNKLFPANYFSKKYFIKDFGRKTEKEIPVLAGACMLIRKDIFSKVKGFDKRFFMYFEEADLCLRISKSNYKVLYYPPSKVIHLIGKSSNDKKWIEKVFEQSRYEFLKKYHGRLMGTIGEGLIRILNFPAKLL